MFKLLLVPTDGSALSEEAIRMGVSLARESGAKVTAVHVIPKLHIFAYGPEMLTDTEEHFLKIARQQADDYLGAATKAATAAGVECEGVATTRAHPYEAILSVAAQRKCDLIVMASHGRGGVRALLIGSETQMVLTHSNIPVLVVRPSASAGKSHEEGSEKSSTSSTTSHDMPVSFIIARVASPAYIPTTWQASGEHRHH
jgi:nucleotide-binding universal stress UspA family protein